MLLREKFLRNRNYKTPRLPREADCNCLLARELLIEQTAS